MVYLFQNMRSIMSCQKICAPNHVQLQLSVGVLNGLLDSDYIQPVIQNTINSLDFMNLFWTKPITKRTKMSLMQQKCHQWYYVNFFIYEYLSFNWKIHGHNRWNKDVIDGYFLDFSNKYISNISNIYNPNENMSIESQIKCDNMFTDPEVG